MYLNIPFSRISKAYSCVILVAAVAVWGHDACCQPIQTQQDRPLLIFYADVPTDAVVDALVSHLKELAQSNTAYLFDSIQDLRGDQAPIFTEETYQRAAHWYVARYPPHSHFAGLRSDVQQLLNRLFVSTVDRRKSMLYIQVNTGPNGGRSRATVYFQQSARPDGSADESEKASRVEIRGDLPLEDAVRLSMSQLIPGVNKNPSLLFEVEGGIRDSAEHWKCFLGDTLIFDMSKSTDYETPLREMRFSVEAVSGASSPGPNRQVPSDAGFIRVPVVFPHPGVFGIKITVDDGTQGYAARVLTVEAIRRPHFSILGHEIVHLIQSDILYPGGTSEELDSYLDVRVDTVDSDSWELRTRPLGGWNPNEKADTARVSIGSPGTFRIPITGMISSGPHTVEVFARRNDSIRTSGQVVSIQCIERPSVEMTFLVEGVASLAMSLDESRAHQIPDGHAIVAGCRLHFGRRFVFEPNICLYSPFGQMITARVSFSACYLLSLGDVEYGPRVSLKEWDGANNNAAMKCGIGLECGAWITSRLKFIIGGDIYLINVIDQSVGNRGGIRAGFAVGVD
jgi:hypothetical protein